MSDTSPNRPRGKVKRDDYEDDRDGDDRRESSKRANTKGSDEVRSLESTLRFLVSNSSAGSVIGKGGAVISEFQTQSAAKIVLSRAKEFFPGTSDRIILLTGTVSAILTALHLILSKLADDAARGGTAPREEDMELRIVVPDRVCGAIIGKSGATIKSFAEDSQATLKLSSQDTSAGTKGFKERLVTVGGKLEHKLRAVALLLTKISDDPTYKSYVDIPLSYTAGGSSTGAGGPGPPGNPGVDSGFAGGSGFSGAGGGSSRGYGDSYGVGNSSYGGGGGYGGGSGGFNGGGYGGSSGYGSSYNAPYSSSRGPPPYALNDGPPPRGKPPPPPPMLHGNPLPNTIIVAVPDEHIGSVVGKGGRSLQEIQQTSGVRMSISDRGDYVPGTTNRKVTVTGPPNAVVAAQHMIAQKVQQSIAASGGGLDRGGGTAGYRDARDTRVDRGDYVNTYEIEKERDRDRERERGGAREYEKPREYERTRSREERASRWS